MRHLLHLAVGVRTPGEHWRWLVRHFACPACDGGWWYLGWRESGYRILGTAVLYFGELPLFGDGLWWAYRTWGTTR